MDGGLRRLVRKKFCEVLSADLAPQLEVQSSAGEWKCVEERETRAQTEADPRGGNKKIKEKAESAPISENKRDVLIGQKESPRQPGSTVKLKPAQVAFFFFVKRSGS